MPCGIVRVISASGSIYEGQMINNGKKNGWGIHYGGNQIHIGWYNEGLLNGN